MTIYNTDRKRAAAAPRTTAAAGAVDRIRRWRRRFRKDTAGAVVVLAALGMPIAIGGMGLGAEVGYWYYTQRLLQHAADTAAHGAGVRKRQGDGYAQVETVALKLASDGGFDGGAGTITVNSPPTSGPNAGNTRAIEVVLSETLPRMFTGMFSDQPVTVSSRAVSLFSNPGKACVLALAPNASSALMASGSGVVNLLNCDTASNSMAIDSFDMQGAAGYSTACLHTVGLAQPTAGLTLTNCAAVDELAPITPDPYQDVPMPSIEGWCHAGRIGSPNQAVTVTPTHSHSSYAQSGLKSRRYCSGLTVQGRVHFDPGIYIVSGGDFFANAQAEITGDNVIFFFTGGAASRINGGAELHLSAPTSGTYAGILFFGDRTEPQIDHHVNGGSLSTFDGAIYFPSQRVVYNGGAIAAGGCTQIIGYTINFTGDSAVGLDCTGAGVRDIDVAGAVSVVE